MRRLSLAWCLWVMTDACKCGVLMVVKCLRRWSKECQLDPAWSTRRDLTPSDVCQFSVAQAMLGLPAWLPRGEPSLAFPECHSDKGCVELVGAPEHLAVPNASLAVLRRWTLGRYPFLFLEGLSSMIIVARHSFLKSLVCGQCTRWQTAGRPGRFSNTGHRDKTCGLAEISSTPVTTAWPRSGRRVSPRLVGDQFFQCAHSLSEIDPCF